MVILALYYRIINFEYCKKKYLSESLKEVFYKTYFDIFFVFNTDPFQFLQQVLVKAQKVAGV